MIEKIISITERLIGFNGIKNIVSKYVIIGIKTSPTPIEAIIVDISSVFHRSLVITNPGIRIIINEMMNWIEVR
jgi:hypothetical protein